MFSHTDTQSFHVLLDSREQGLLPLELCSGIWVSQRNHRGKLIKMFWVWYLIGDYNPSVLVTGADIRLALRFWFLISQSRGQVLIEWMLRNYRLKNQIPNNDLMQYLTMKTLPFWGGLHWNSQGVPWTAETADSWEDDFWGHCHITACTWLPLSPGGRVLPSSCPYDRD